VGSTLLCEYTTVPLSEEESAYKRPETRRLGPMNGPERPPMVRVVDSPQAQLYFSC
jgi:hypothetical protein